MEGVGARLGRSSTRYGPTIVFTGPVRKWKKKWIHVSPSNHHSQANNGGSNGNNGSHLQLYKWSPITQSQNGNSNSNGDKSSSKDDDSDETKEPPRRKFKYIPIAVLEEQKIEAEELVDDEAKPSDIQPTGVEETSKTDGFDEKPDINDVPMDESQAEDDNPVERQDLNESTLDLSLGLANDGDPDSETKTDQTGEAQLERVNSSRGRT